MLVTAVMLIVEFTNTRWYLSNLSVKSN